MNRADTWASFAAAAMAGNLSRNAPNDNSARNAAVEADRLLREYDERFPNGEKEQILNDLWERLCACPVITSHWPDNGGTKLLMLREDASKAVRQVFGEKAFLKATQA